MFRLSWKAVAIGASLVALGCGVLLVIVSSIRDADTLSVVALALAVVAFVIQIMTYILQTNSSSRQERSVLEINADTLRALATIEEKSEGTRQSVDKISDKMLGVIIDKATTEVALGTGTGQRNDVSSIVRRSLDLVTERRADELNSPPPVTADRVQDRTMRSMPSADRLSEAVARVSNLSTSDVVTLKWLGEDQESYGGEPSLLGVRHLHNADHLHKLGLVKRVQEPSAEAPVFRLTDLGKDVARLLLVPAHSVQHIPELTAAREYLRQDEERDRRLFADQNYADIPIE